MPITQVGGKDQLEEVCFRMCEMTSRMVEGSLASGCLIVVVRHGGVQQGYTVRNENDKKPRPASHDANIRAPAVIFKSPRSRGRVMKIICWAQPLVALILTSTTAIHRPASGCAGLAPNARGVSSLLHPAMMVLAGLFRNGQAAWRFSTTGTPPVSGHACSPVSATTVA